MKENDTQEDVAQITRTCRRTLNYPYRHYDQCQNEAFTRLINTCKKGENNRTLLHAGTESHRTRITSVSFYRTTLLLSNILSAQTTTTNSLATSALSSYSKFKIALKSKEVQRQYPNLLEKFLDFCKFEGLDVEQKAINFSCFAKSRSQEEVEDLLIRFILFQKERIDKKEITSGTLRNYVKAIKLFTD